MRQQAKTTIYRLAPVVMLAITVAAPSEMERAMKNFTQTSVRAAAAIATFVALISSVGAPWKWS